jgi:hypothetical protein
MRSFLTLTYLFLFASNLLQAGGGTIPVTVSASSNEFTCAISSITLYASTTATGVSYYWKSTNGFESDQQNPVINAPGTYTVTVKNTTGSGKASITITENYTCPDVTASGSSLACLPKATLYANSTVPNVQYSWGGPYYFESTLQRPTVVDAGTYTVTVTDPTNGCSTSKAVEVTSEAAATIWAANFTVPDGTTRIDTGRYQWTATHNGTTATKFSPINYEFRAGNTGAGKEGVWTSQAINIANKANVGVAVHVRSYVTGSGQFESDTSATGDYLRLYYKLDGGVEIPFAEVSGAINNNYENYTTASTRSLVGSTIQIVIRARATEADEFYYFDNVTVTGISGTDVQATVSGSNMISCLSSAAALSGTSSVSGSSFAWFGPNGYTSTEQSPTVSTPGSYILMVTEPVKGCTDTANVTVILNNTAPVEISINNSGIINCLNASITISGSSSTAGVLYSWAGPGGFSASTPSATVSQGGIYTLTATNPVNGCYTSKSTTVVENTASPALTIINSNAISCSNPTVTLSAVTNTPDASFLWLGPDFVDVAGTTTTSIAGLYIIIVTDPANGCSTTGFTEVSEDYSDCGARKVTTTATANTAGQNTPMAAITSFTCKAFPNPVTTNSVIEFASPENTHAIVRIYNSLGNCEKILFNGAITANRSYRVAIPASQLTAGAYYYIINTGGKAYTGKLVIMK